MSYVLTAMAARTCYECSSILDIGGYDSTDGCKDEDPDTGKLREIKVPDEDECYLCSKIINKATNAGTSNNCGHETDASVISVNEWRHCVVIQTSVHHLFSSCVRSPL